MWQYRHTDELYHSSDELYHYGVLGMKWGHRRSASIMGARNAYKQASKDLRKAKIKRTFSKSTYLAGHDNVVANKKSKANIKRLETKKEKSAFKLTDKQAQYAYDKKLSKTGNKSKAEKAAQKVYAKSFNKNKGGLPGSINDEKSGGRDTRYYNHLSSIKGKKYADAVEKKYKKGIYTKAGAAAGYLAGVTAYNLYKLHKLK